MIQGMEVCDTPLYIDCVLHNLSFLYIHLMKTHAKRTIMRIGSFHSPLLHIANYHFEKMTLIEKRVVLSMEQENSSDSASEQAIFGASISRMIRQHICHMICICMYEYA